MTRGRWELVAAIATGAIHLFISEVLKGMAWFIVGALVCWSVYIARRWKADAAAWGFRGGGWLGPIVLLVAGAAGMAAIGTPRFDSGLILLLAIYPFWALFEQFLLQAMMVRNMPGSAGFVTPVAASLFCLDHWPDYPLMGATFFLALVLTPFYLRWRRIVPLALAHGWLGKLFFCWVLGRDPLHEIFKL